MIYLRPFFLLVFDFAYRRCFWKRFDSPPASTSSNNPWSSRDRFSPREPCRITVVSILCSRENSISGIEIHTSSRFLRVITFLRRSFSCSSTSWIPTRLLKSLRFCKIEKVSFQDIHERLYNQKCVLALLHQIRCQSAFCYCSGVASSPFS